MSLINLNEISSPRWQVPDYLIVYIYNFVSHSFYLPHLTSPCAHIVQAIQEEMVNYPIIPFFTKKILYILSILYLYSQLIVFVISEKKLLGIFIQFVNAGIGSIGRSTILVVIIYNRRRIGCVFSVENSSSN